MSPNFTVRIPPLACIATAALAAAGCARTAAAPPDFPQDLRGDSYVLRCEGDHRFGATINPDTVHLLLGDRMVPLPRAISASGARYTDGENTFWNSGREVRLEAGAATYPACLLQPVATAEEATHLLAGGAPEDSALSERDWQLMSTGGLPAIPSGESPPTLRFGEEGTLAAMTGCNQLSGRFAAQGGALSLPTPPAITERACLEPGLMEQERRLVAALIQADAYYIWGGVLTLLDGEEILARFTTPD